MATGFRSSLIISEVALLLLLVTTTSTGGLVAQAQDACTTQLSTLTTCAPFVMPGASNNPSAECCGALRAVPRDCICNTLHISSRLPASCSMPPLDCAN